MQARINSKHEVLEIGFGWGSLALALVRRTGCKYTGITLSEEQLKYAQRLVKEACLEVLSSSIPVTMLGKRYELPHLKLRILCCYRD